MCRRTSLQIRQLEKSKSTYDRMPHRWGSRYSTMSPVKQRNQRGLASCGEVATTQQASVESQRIIIIVKHSYDLPSSIMLGTQEIEKQRQHRQQQPHRTKRESLRYARLTHLPCLSLSLPSLLRQFPLLACYVDYPLACFATTIQLCIQMHTNNPAG